jgi:Zn-dependent peptidase ImmA (M78 family)/transcriptional regulator with XRE-family HTH domain
VAFQGERLIFARKKRQVSQKDLASTAGVTPRSLQRYERDEESPKADTLARLADALKFPPEFFTDPRPLPNIPPLSISFRGYSKIKAKLRDNAVTVAQLAVGIEAVLAKDFDLPELDVPDLTEATSDPVQAAKLLREEWSLGTGPIPSVVHVLERHGVRVFSADAEADVDAFCFWNDGRAFAILSRAKSPERGRFDGAHELGHLTCHRTEDFHELRSKDVEREADAFAGEFLVPSAALAAHAPSRITAETVMKLKRAWGVSEMAMIRRLKEIGRISDWTYRRMCIDAAKAGARRAERNGMKQHETSSLLADMIASEEGVSVRDLANELHVSPGDITALVFDLPLQRRGLRLVHSA